MDGDATGRCITWDIEPGAAGCPSLDERDGKMTRSDPLGPHPGVAASLASSKETCSSLPFLLALCH